MPDTQRERKVYIVTTDRGPTVFGATINARIISHEEYERGRGLQWSSGDYGSFRVGHASVRATKAQIASWIRSGQTVAVRRVRGRGR